MADLRKCIGSARFGIESHEALVEDFPVQPSQKDGLGRLCKTHWNLYTTALRKAAAAAKADTTAPTGEPTNPEPADAKPSRKRKASAPGVVEPEPATA